MSIAEAAPKQTSEAARQQVLEIRSPATGEFVGVVAVSSPEEIVETVARARAAQQKWHAAGFRARAAVVRKFHDLLHAHRERILDTIQDETGKARRDALGEFLSLVSTCRYYLKNGRRILRRQTKFGALPTLTSAEVTFHPLGVVGFITPWNYPFLLAIDDAIPALLAGNTTVTKPSELTPHCANLVQEILLEAGLPQDVFGLVHGAGEVGAALIDRVDGLAFTGSAATGRKVAAAAGARLIPCSLELGGKNPAIVLEGADNANAVEGILPGVFFNSGQTCINIERLYLPQSRFDEFLETAKARTEQLRVAHEKTFRPDMGSLISLDHRSKVQEHVDDATSKGAAVITGGSSLDSTEGAFYAPTILAQVPDDAVLCREETFGPVVSVYPYTNIDHAVAMANDTDYGLNASVWGPPSEARQVAERIAAGSVGVNSTLMVYNCVDAPMGGIKASGYGRRHGDYGMTRFTQQKTISSSFTQHGGYDAILGQLKSDRIAGWASQVMNRMRWIPRL